MRISLNVAGGSFACTGTLVHVLETVASTWCVLIQSLKRAHARGHLTQACSFCLRCLCLQDIGHADLVDGVQFPRDQHHHLLWHVSGRLPDRRRQVRARALKAAASAA